MSVLDEITERPDVIVIDPPRSGIHYKALPKITSYGVNQILYISCNPKTMGENLKYMENNGYIVKNIKGYDNFPSTRHIEAVALLEKR
jgi:23S rRNA (uracil1939-C5)-methyltransferase